MMTFEQAEREMTRLERTYPKPASDRLLPPGHTSTFITNADAVILTQIGGVCWRERTERVAQLKTRQRRFLRI